ncbi:hypothetical protein A11A3_11287 [Alcanivorax hongdengensis A-11-3]|uniref:DUF4845 domain-containing protein n=2 Tax=Alcanivorax hongdengensis TaxID=519051 RepID=L0WCW2_9GAMM|nr:hypothetical protein A11A3_11287 [Alcanivorax hongdengensis A-11-3]
MEYSTISTAINSVLNDSRTAMMSPSEIRTSIDKRFTINQVDAIKSDDLVISREGSMLTIATDYEVREPLFYNVSVVMDFKHEFKKDIRQ